MTKCTKLEPNLASSISIYIVSSIYIFMPLYINGYLTFVFLYVCVGIFAFETSNASLPNQLPVNLGFFLKLINVLLQHLALFFNGEQGSQGVKE